MDTVFDWIPMQVRPSLECLVFSRVSWLGSVLYSGFTPSTTPYGMKFSNPIENSRTCINWLPHFGMDTVLVWIDWIIWINTLFWEIPHLRIDNHACFNSATKSFGVDTSMGVDWIERLLWKRHTSVSVWFSWQNSDVTVGPSQFDSKQNNMRWFPGIVLRFLHFWLITLRFIFDFSDMRNLFLMSF